MSTNPEVLSGLLKGKVGLVTGVANGSSIAAGCARMFRAAGAELALTYLNERARPFVLPVAEEVGADLLLPMDVTDDAGLAAVFDAIHEHHGKLDFLLHSIAFCPKDDLHGRVTDCSREGFGIAMDVSVHSFIRMAKLAEPLMADGGCLLTVSYYGGEQVVDHYNVMGPVKAALEASVRYLAAELGPKGIRVNAVSPGPLKTRAASGIDHFDELVEAARKRAPSRRLVSIDEVGAIALGLVSDFSSGVTGNIAFVDGGYHVVD
ncbi:enoyl-ACP reductase FabI [Zavarzinia compransoris]|uniref:enoyl-ACP reductase FabI n=1 Tax=Zavarzinia marina TaxID=2911065 RepID=UPI001F4260F5|nr:enoyl-ACP reductase FabI [Zavarzinia marina]MCF4164141.1 enoyl-ACP reductase FabI [Zavarzinia marina]